MSHAETLEWLLTEARSDIERLLKVVKAAQAHMRMDDEETHRALFVTLGMNGPYEPR